MGSNAGIHWRAPGSRAVGAFAEKFMSIPSLRPSFCGIMIHR